MKYMKKLIVLLIIMMLGATGCKKDSAETQASPVVTATPVPTAVPTIAPEFVMPNEDAFFKQSSSILIDIGVRNVKDAVLENVEETAERTDMDMKIMTDEKTLLLSASYMSSIFSDPEWFISYISDYEKSEVYYWILDEDGLMAEVDAVLEEAGVDDVEDIIIENVEQVETTIGTDVKIITGKRVLKLSAIYSLFISDPEWFISYISDYEKSEVYYWLPEELRKQEDIYDYKTGKLISKKSEEPKTTEEIWAEYEKKSKEIEKKYEKGLQDILDGMEK